MSLKEYIEQMIMMNRYMFSSNPKTTVSSLLKRGDHPETNMPDFLDPDEVQQYQYPMNTAVMALSSFQATYRQGHMDHAKHVYGYLAKMNHGDICVQTKELDYSTLPEEPEYASLPEQESDWNYSIYRDIQEILAKDMLEPLEKYISLTHATVETARYESELCAACTCKEQIIDLFLRYLGICIQEQSHKFRDNETVVKSSIRPHAKLDKCHTASSFHHVRKAISSKFIVCHHIPSVDNPADVLSKHWGSQQVWKLLQPLLFWHGDTGKLLDEASE
jgi:hypothetical protein